MKKFDSRELATVLAALRYFQANKIHAGLMSEEHFAEATPLGDDEIDELCERLNGEELRRTKAVCHLCHKVVNAEKAHADGSHHIGDECCWDERMRS